MTIIGGHQRYKVLVDMGYSEVDCVVVDLNKDKEKALNIALNKISGEWDEEKLITLLLELGGAVELTGFDDKELADLLSSKEEIIEDDFNAADEAEKIVVPISKPGDIWLLGRHRLMCGDSTVLTDVQLLMGGEFADMIFTDPPYNVDYQGGTKEKLKIKNDKMTDTAFYKFLYDAHICMFAVTKPGGAIYVCHADSEGLNFRKALKDSGWLLKQCIIWAKNSMVMGRQDYQWKHEPILYGWKPGAPHNWSSDRKQTTLWEESANVVIRKEKGYSLITFTNGIYSASIKVPELELIYSGDDIGTSLWRFEKPLRNGSHPTMKPVGIPARAIKNSSRTNDIVLDLFGGSGSTLIAAEQTSRRCYTCELDLVYCDVIVKRWEAFTGQKAVLLNA